MNNNTTITIVIVVVLLAVVGVVAYALMQSSAQNTSVLSQALQNQSSNAQEAKGKGSTIGGALGSIWDAIMD